MQKINPVTASIFVIEGLFIFTYFLLTEETHQNRFSRAGEKILQQFCSFLVKWLLKYESLRIGRLCDIIPKAQSSQFLNLPVFMNVKWTPDQNSRFG